MHVYLHVPFCGRRCSYCDFAIAVRATTPDDQYVASVSREWDARVAERTVDPISTIYFGGGTPSRLSPASINSIVRHIGSTHALASGAEITLETNPDDVSESRVDAWVAAGVNRVSLGVQSHDPKILDWMHRTHRAEQVAPAVRMLRVGGIANVSMDLIYSLPDGLSRDWRDDLERTLALDPSHLSLYGLTVEPRTPLARWVQRGDATPGSDDRYATEYLLAHELAGASGFTFYEVSNAAKPGLRSRHNSAYWTGARYIGLGPSAHSFDGTARHWNVREWSDYLQRSVNGADLREGSETLDAASRTLESRYLGLRSDAGISEGSLPAGTVSTWLREGWATVGGGQLRLTVEGWLRLDALVAAAQDS